MTNTNHNFKLGGYYQLTGQATNHQPLFYDEQDYKVFEYYLYIYLAPPQTVLHLYPFLPPRLQAQNLHQDLSLLCYCLIPNQIHLLIHLDWLTGADTLIKQLTTAYTNYLKLKYPSDQVSLPQLSFQSLEITKTADLSRAIKSIHLTPPTNHPWSSAHDYHQNRFRPFLNKHHRPIITQPHPGNLKASTEKPKSKTKILPETHLN